ncbi:MAG: arylsulfatase B [Planctomycetota bacterium]|jgi:arylsulfatase A-like enzyme
MVCAGRAALFLAIWLVAFGATTAEAAPRPHIVLFLADDLGWRDVGFHGSEIKTPHLDRLAASGARLEQFYVQPVCSPTRSSLMTGRYPIRQGLQVGVIKPWARHGLPLNERTLAQALQEAGYRTAITGKWHLGLHEPAYLPTRRGFDHQYGHYCGALDYFTHLRNGGLDWHRDDQALEEKGYTTQLIAREAVRLIGKHDPSRPLFLYVPFNAAHTPLQAPDEYVRRYRDLPRRRRRIFAAMVTCMDDAIGAVLGALEKRRMRENTLVFFASDNGGAPAADNGPLRGRKGTLYEGGVRVPALISWPGKLKPGSVVRAPLHIVDLYPTLLKLAGASLEQPLPLDGMDVWVTLAGDAPSPRREILHNLEPHRAALRRGDWKLVLSGRDVFGAAAGVTTELFDLAADPYEKNNLAAKHPQKVKELSVRLKQYAKEAVPPKNQGRRRRPADFKTPKVWGEPD